MADDAAGEPPFDEVVDVATGWVFDYMYSCLCYYFTAGDRAEEFQRTCKAMEVILEAMPTLDSEKKKALSIVQFLTRVQQGKLLDVQFEADEKLTPLETAVVAISRFEEEENLKNLQEEIKTLVKVQAVAVCMEKGKFKMASEVLDRQFDESEGSEYLRMKLIMVIGKKAPYHEFLENFAYNKMLQKIESYINLLLARRPPVFLLQAARKVVEAKIKHDTSAEEDQDHSRPNSASLDKGDGKSSSECEHVLQQENSVDLQNYKVAAEDLMEEEGQTADKSTDKPQRRLFSLGVGTPWHPDKTALTSKILRKPILKKGSMDNQENILPKRCEKPSNSGASKKKQPWTPEEDNQLIKGVKKYGMGNWQKILAHYEFNNRKGVMLKDRWRTMKKLDMVDDV